MTRSAEKQVYMSIQFRTPDWEDNYRAVETKSDQHQEEDERPERRHRQRWDGFRVDNEHESRTYITTTHVSELPSVATLSIGVWDFLDI